MRVNNSIKHSIEYQRCSYVGKRDTEMTSCRARFIHYEWPHTPTVVNLYQIKSISPFSEMRLVAARLISVSAEKTSYVTKWKGFCDAT